MDTHTSARRLGTMLSAALLIAGCAGSTAPDSGDARGSLERRLADGLALDLEPELSRVRIAGDVSGERFTREDLAVREGELRLHTSGRETLVLESLRASIVDIRISPEVVPPEGLHLTDIRAEIASPVEGAITWVADEGYAELTVELVASWSLMTRSGGPVALAPQHVEDLVLGIMLRTDAGGILVAELSAEAQGDLIHWPTVADVDRLTLDLTARELPF